MNEAIRLGEALGYVDVHLLRIMPAFDPDDHYSPRGYVVEASGDVTATTTAGFWASDTLGRFLTALADDFRGWSGERTWRSVDGELRVIATHHSGGHLRLRWTLADRYEPSWELTVTTTVDAGEDMRRLAADVRAAERNG